MDRQAPNVNLRHSADDAAWYLLVEFSTREFLSDRSRSDGLRAGFLTLPHQELDTVPEWVANLEAMLARFAREVWEDLGPVGRVRLFCQRKIIDDACFERPASQLDSAGLRMERAHSILDPRKKINGGWGCYAIEKGRDSTDTASKEACHIIEVYIYRESIDTP